MKRSHVRWLSQHFLTDPAVIALQPRLRLRKGWLILSSHLFAEGLELHFGSHKARVAFFINQKWIDDLHWEFEFDLRRCGNSAFCCAICERELDEQGKLEIFSSVQALYKDHVIDRLLRVLKEGRYFQDIRWKVTDGYQYAEFVKGYRDPLCRPRSFEAA